MIKSGVMPDHNAQLDIPIMQNNVSTQNALPSNLSESSIKEKESFEKLSLSVEQKITREGKTLEKELKKYMHTSCNNKTKYCKSHRSVVHRERKK